MNTEELNELVESCNDFIILADDILENSQEIINEIIRKEFNEEECQKINYKNIISNNKINPIEKISENKTTTENDDYIIPFKDGIDIDEPVELIKPFSYDDQNIFENTNIPDRDKSKENTVAIDIPDDIKNKIILPKYFIDELDINTKLELFDKLSKISVEIKDGEIYGMPMYANNKLFKLIKIKNTTGAVVFYNINDKDYKEFEVVDSICRVKTYNDLAA